MAKYSPFGDQVGSPLFSNLAVRITSSWLAFSRLIGARVAVGWGIGVSVLVGDAVCEGEFVADGESVGLEVGVGGIDVALACASGSAGTVVASPSGVAELQATRTSNKKLRNRAVFFIWLFLIFLALAPVGSS